MLIARGGFAVSLDDAPCPAGLCAMTMVATPSTLTTSVTPQKIRTLVMPGAYALRTADGTRRGIEGDAVSLQTVFDGKPHPHRDRLIAAPRGLESPAAPRIHRRPIEIGMPG